MVDSCNTTQHKHANPRDCRQRVFHFVDDEVVSGSTRGSAVILSKCAGLLFVLSAPVLRIRLGVIGVPFFLKLYKFQAVTVCSCVCVRVLFDVTVVTCSGKPPPPRAPGRACSPGSQEKAGGLIGNSYEDIRAAELANRSLRKAKLS